MGWIKRTHTHNCYLPPVTPTNTQGDTWSCEGESADDSGYTECSAIWVLDHHLNWVRTK